MPVDLQRFVKLTKSSATVGHAEMIAEIARGRPDFCNFAGGDNVSDVFSGVVQAGQGFFAGDTLRMPYPVVRGQPDALDALLEFQERTARIKLPVVTDEDDGSVLKLRRSHGLITPGGKYAVALTLWAIATAYPGSSVLIFRRYWPTFASLARGFGLNPIFVGSIEEFDALPRELAKKISLVIVNNPRNPDGYVYSRTELLQIYGISEQKCPGCMFLGDEVYRLNLYPGVEFVSLQSVVGVDQCVSLFSGSKGPKMAGGRWGTAVGPKELIGWMAGQQSETTGGVALPIQHLIPPALSELGCGVARRQMEEFVAFRDTITAWAGEEPAYEAIVPKGTIYYSVDISALIGRTVRMVKIESAKTLAMIAAKHFDVGVMFNDPSGDPNSIRMNLAQVRDLDHLIRGLRALSELAAEAA